MAAGLIRSPFGNVHTPLICIFLTDHVNPLALGVLVFLPSLSRQHQTLSCMLVLSNQC